LPVLEASCGENECFVTLPKKVLLFLDAEAVGGKLMKGAHCDCIVIEFNGKGLTIYSVELKNVREKGVRKIMEKDELKMKCENCIKYALKLVGHFGIPVIEKQCVLVVPSEVVVLIKKNLNFFKAPSASSSKVVSCNTHLKSSY